MVPPSFFEENTDPCSAAHLFKSHKTRIAWCGFGTLRRRHDAVHLLKMVFLVLLKFFCFLICFIVVFTSYTWFCSVGDLSFLDFLESLLGSMFYLF